MPNSQIQRIFLVGCPRSGTTLLQSFLAAHPDLISFPESHFFIHLLSKRKPYQQKLKIASPRAKLRFQQFLQEIDRADLERYLPKYALFTPQYARAFVKILDTLAQEQSKSIWIEKTPDHVLFIDEIEKLVNGAKFIHIVRNATDVVASLYEVTRKHPQAWHGAWDIDKCLRKWLECAKSSNKHLPKPNHFLVHYEKLVAEPELVLQTITNFLEISFNYETLQERRGEVAQIVLDNEPWKASVAEPLNNANSKKFYEIFNEAERDYITQKLAIAKRFTNLGVTGEKILK
jgi:Sulfotransferase family